MHMLKEQNPGLEITRVESIHGRGQRPGRVYIHFKDGSEVKVIEVVSTERGAELGWQHADLTVKGVTPAMITSISDRM